MVIRETIDHGGPQGGQAVRLEKMQETMVSGMVPKGVVPSLFFDLCDILRFYFILTKSWYWEVSTRSSHLRNSMCVSGRSCLGRRPRQQLGFVLCDFEHHICSIFWGWYSLFVAGWFEQIGHLPNPLLLRYLWNLIPEISLYHLLANVQWFAHSSRKLSALSGPFWIYAHSRQFQKENGH